MQSGYPQCCSPAGKKILIRQMNNQFANKIMPLCTYCLLQFIVNAAFGISFIFSLVVSVAAAAEVRAELSSSPVLPFLLRYSLDDGSACTRK